MKEIVLLMEVDKTVILHSISMLICIRIGSCKQYTPSGPIPHNLAETFDGPPTLERSGSEHRVGRLHPSF